MVNQVILYYHFLNMQQLSNTWLVYHLELYFDYMLFLKWLVIVQVGQFQYYSRLIPHGSG